MRKFLSNQSVVNHLQEKNKKLIMPIIIAIISCFTFLFKIISYDEINTASSVALLFVVFIVFAIVYCINKFFATNILSENINRCQLEIYDSFLRGAYSNNYFKKDSVCFFEISFNQIINIEKKEVGTIYGEYFNLIIYTNSKKYQLSLENIDEAYFEIQNAIKATYNKEESAEANFK